MATGMPKNFVRKTFDRWLAHSAARFRHPPRVVVSRKDYFVLRFTGITPAIEGVIRKEGMVEIYAMYGEDVWDILTEFDVSERRTPTGRYYCHLCPTPEMFPSRAALWVAHSFEPLLAWTNTHFQASQWLWLCRVGGTTWAGLAPMEGMQASKNAADLVYACPVVQRRPSQTAGA
jgi:hypothetical protein